MSPVDDDLREMLRRRAADQVPMHRDVPRRMVRRARGRIALNAVIAGVSVAAASTLVFAGVRSLRVEPVQHVVPPAASSSQTPPSASTAPPASTATTTACTGGQLRAVGSMDGAAGSRQGSIRFTNYSDKTCTLQGTPKITLLARNLHPITSGLTFTA